MLQLPEHGPIRSDKSQMRFGVLPACRSGRRSRPEADKQAACRYGGFTVVELLVVVAIVGLLVALLVPSLSQARALARVSACLSNQKQIGIGIVLYAKDANNSLPLGRNDFEATTGGGWLWFKRISPLVNAPVSTTMTDNTNTVFACPSHDRAQRFTAYGLRLSYGVMLMLGPVTPAGDPWHHRFGDITTSRNEPPLRLFQFTRPGEAGLLGENDNYYRFGFYLVGDQYHLFHHGTSMNALFADGHAGNMSETEYNDRTSDTSDTFVFYY